MTSLTFQLFPIPPKLATSLLTWKIESAADVLAGATEFFANRAPNELGATFVLFDAESRKGQATAGKRDLRLAAVLVFNGPPDGADAMFNVLRRIRTPSTDATQVTSYFEFLRTQFPAVPPTFHQYPRSGFVSGALARSDAEQLVNAFSIPSNTTNQVDNIVFFEFTGGAVNYRKPDATAFVHRTSAFVLSIWANWMSDQPGEDQGEVAWANRTYDAVKRALNGEVYQNYPDRTLQDFRQAYYGTNFARLLDLKRKYDPANRFAFEQGITP